MHISIISICLYCVGLYCCQEFVNLNVHTKNFAVWKVSCSMAAMAGTIPEYNREPV